MSEYWVKHDKDFISFVRVRNGRAYSLTRKGKWIESHTLGEIQGFEPVPLFDLVERLVSSGVFENQWFGMALCLSL